MATIPHSSIDLATYETLKHMYIRSHGADSVVRARKLWMRLLLLLPGLALPSSAVCSLASFSVKASRLCAVRMRDHFFNNRPTRRLSIPPRQESLHCTGRQCVLVVVVFFFSISFCFFFGSFGRGFNCRRQRGGQSCTTASWMSSG